MPSDDCLHSLTMDFEFAPTSVRPAFVFEPAELARIAQRAGSDGLPLLVLCTPTLLHLVSTNKSHVRAFRPVLARIHERARNAEGWGALPVRIARGSESARQLLRHAIPNAPTEPGVRQFAAVLRAAAMLSQRAGAFSAELGALLRMIEQTVSRVCDETGLGRFGSGSAELELELETLVAQRIIEEELVAWQACYPALRSSRHPISNAGIGAFEAEEPHSGIRLPARSVLSKLRAV